MSPLKVVINLSLLIFFSKISTYNFSLKTSDIYFRITSLQRSCSLLIREFSEIRLPKISKKNRLKSPKESSPQLKLKNQLDQVPAIVSSGV